MRALASNRHALVGGAILAFFALIAIFGPLLTGDPNALVGLPHQPPSGEHPFGTTGQGQDVLAQTAAGARSTLLLGFGVGFAVTAVGALVGIAAAYFGGIADELLSTLINVFLILPGLPLAVVLAAYLPPGPLTLGLVLVVTGWSWNARVLRSQALSLRSKDFVSAAIVGGESHLYVMFREILPNMTSLLVSAFIGATVYAIGAQVGLEFLGIGDVNVVTWGTNLYWASNDSALLTGSWWTFVPTGVSIALVGFALVLLNAAVDELTNPRLSAAGAGSRPRRRGAARLTTPVVRRAHRGAEALGVD